MPARQWMKVSPRDQGKPRAILTVDDLSRFLADAKVVESDPAAVRARVIGNVLATVRAALDEMEP